LFFVEISETFLRALISSDSTRLAASVALLVPGPLVLSSSGISRGVSCSSAVGRGGVADEPGYQREAV
jgi:hypothetical protein